MSKSDQKLTVADGVEGGADDPGLGSGEWRNASAVGAVAGVTEGQETCDAAADGGGELAGKTVSDSTTLRVAASDNDSLGALGGSQVVKSDTLANGGGGGTDGQGVVADCGGVGTTDTLAGNVAAAKAGLQSGADIGTKSGALFVVSSCSND